MTRETRYSSSNANSGEALSLFLASTVSAMHRNAHIWNGSHPLLVTYYCWVTVYSPSMKANKTKCQKYMTTSGSRTHNIRAFKTCIYPLSYSWNRTRWVYFLVWAYENQPIDFSPSMFTLKRCALECFTSSNEWIDFCTTIQTDLLAYEFLCRLKSTLQYKSKQPHAPLRLHTFGSSSIHLFPKSAVLLLQVPAKRDPK